MKRSQVVDEDIIEDFEYGELSQSEHKNNKKKKVPQDIEEVVEGIE
jgi:hypothetical protein